MTTGFGVDHDHFRGRPIPATPLDVVSTSLQGVDDLVCNLGLHPQQVRVPLMMEARCRDGGLGIHLPVDDIQDRQQRRRDDPGPARTPGHHEESTVPVENGRGHARKWPLARCDKICTARINEPVAIGCRLRDREIIHLVIQDDARPGDRNPRTKGRIDRHRESHRAPLRIGHREMRRPGVVGNGTRTRNRGGCIQIDSSPLGVCVRLRHEPVDRNVDEIRIAHIGRAIRKGQLHRFTHEMNRRRTPTPQSGEIKALEDVQRLDQNRTA